MIKEVIINGKAYTITNEEEYSVEEELVFEIRQDKKYVFVVGMWNDILGLPVRKVWKIVGTSIEN